MLGDNKGISIRVTQVVNVLLFYKVQR